MVRHDFDSELQNLSHAHVRWRDASRDVKHLDELGTQRADLEDARQAMDEARREHIASRGRIHRRPRNDNGVSPTGAPVGNPTAGFTLGITLLIAVAAFTWATWNYSQRPAYELKIVDGSMVESIDECVWRIQGSLENMGREPIELTSLTVSIGSTTSSQLTALPQPPLLHGERIDFGGEMRLTPTNCRRGLDLEHERLMYQFRDDLAQDRLSERGLGF